jgi:hypothetical protein
MIETTLGIARSYKMTVGMRSAWISSCQTYRYALTRELQGRGDPMVFVMLNPSTADALKDDPTIRRCIGFANREGASRLIVLNLFAFRSPSPDRLFSVDKDTQIGPDNDETLRYSVRGVRRIVCAWGADNRARLRAVHVERMLRSAGAELVCLGKTGNGMPRHPLYVKSDQPLVPYKGS